MANEGKSPLPGIIGMVGSALFGPKRERMEYTTLPQSEDQRWATGQLRGMASQPYQPSRLSLQAQDSITQLLQGGYDPASSPYYQATRDELERQSGQAMTGLNRQLQSKGTMYGGRPDIARGNLQAQSQNIVAQVLGNAQEQERGRQFQAIPMANAMGQEEQQYMNQIFQYLQVLMGNQQTMTPKYQYSQNPLTQLAPLFAQLAGGGGGGGGGTKWAGDYGNTNVGTPLYQ